MLYLLRALIYDIIKIKVYDMNFFEFLLFPFLIDLFFILSMNSIVEERVNIYCIFVLETKLFGSNGSSFNGNLVKYLQTLTPFIKYCPT